MPESRAIPGRFQRFPYTSIPKRSAGHSPLTQDHRPAETFFVHHGSSAFLEKNFFLFCPWASMKRDISHPRHPPILFLKNHHPQECRTLGFSF
jgi:hypothetical protein